MAINPLAVMILPTAYIVVSVFVLMQLSVLLSLLATAAVKVRKVEALAAIQPGERRAGPGLPGCSALRALGAALGSPSFPLARNVWLCRLTPWRDRHPPPRPALRMQCCSA